MQGLTINLSRQNKYHYLIVASIFIILLFFTFLIPNHDMKAINTNKIIFVSSPVLAVEDCFLSF